MAQKKRKSLTDEELVKKYGDLEAKEDFSKTVKKIAPKPKKDINQLAKHILDISTGEKPKEDK